MSSVEIVVDPRGKVWDFIHNELNQVIETISPTLSVAGLYYHRFYIYDANDNVTETWVDEGLPGVPPVAERTQFDYEILNHPIRKSAWVEGNHFAVTEFEYDHNRNLTLTKLGEAVNGHQPGNTVKRLYDERGLLYRVIQGEGTPSVSTTQYDYDGNGNLVTVSEGLENAPRVTHSVYDGFNRRIGSTDAMGNTALIHYDPNGNVGGDPGGGLASLHSVELRGQLQDTAGSAGNVLLAGASYEYDAMDRRTKTVASYFDPVTQTDLPGGAATGTVTTLTAYSKTSQVLSVTDDNGHARTYAYDTAHRLRSVTDALGNKTTYTYNDNSDVTQRDDLEKSGVGGSDETYTTTFTRDNLGRVTAVIDRLNNTQQSAYDALNRVVTATDPRGNTTTYAYDGLGRLLTTTRAMTDNGTGTGNPLPAIVTRQTWDDSSRLTSQTDGQGNATVYAYDALNRVTRIEYADHGLEQIVYDVHGNAIHTTDPNGTAVTNTYDLLNRVTVRAVVPGVGSGVAPDAAGEVYTYDGLSRVVRAQNVAADVHRTYDSLGRLLSETVGIHIVTSTYDGVGNRLSLTYPGGRAIGYAPDALNRIVAIGDNVVGGVATYAYDGPGRVRRRDLGNATRTVYTWDGINNAAGDLGVRRVREVKHFRTSGIGLIDHRRLTWNADQDKIAREDLFSGAVQTWSYDSAERMVGSARTPYGGAAATVSYTLDHAGNRTQVDVTGAGPDPGAYVLNPAGMPADAKVNQYTKTPWDRRRYDANGNLIMTMPTTPGGGGSGILGDGDNDGDVDQDDVNAFQACMSGPTVAFASGCGYWDFDNDGDVDLADFAIMQPHLSGAGIVPSTPNIAYDWRNRMVAFIDPASGHRHLYAYDAFGRRVSKTIDADAVPPSQGGNQGGPITTRYVYDGWQIIEERDASDAVTATYVYGNGIDEVLTMNRGGADYWYHADDQGNVVAITDPDGEVLERYEYNDFGQPAIFDNSGTQIPSSSIGNAVMFTGRWYDAETGLYEYRHRYLDPRSGRFTTRDPIGVWGDEENLGNGSTYVANAPFSAIDPLGLQSLRDWDFRSWYSQQMADYDEREWQERALHDKVWGGGIKDPNWFHNGADAVANGDLLLAPVGVAHSFVHFTRQDYWGAGQRIAGAFLPFGAEGVYGVQRAIEIGEALAAGISLSQFLKARGVTLCEYYDASKRGNGGRGGGPEHATVQEFITRNAGGDQEVAFDEAGRAADNVDRWGDLHQIGDMRSRGGYRPSAQQRAAIEDLRRAVGPNTFIYFHDKRGIGPTLINPDLQPNWRPAPTRYLKYPGGEGIIP